MANLVVFTILLAYTCSIFCHLQGVQLWTPTTLPTSRRVPILMSTDCPMLSTACWHTNNLINTTSKGRHVRKRHPNKAYPLCIHFQAGGWRRQCGALQPSIRSRAFLGSSIIRVLHDQCRNRYLSHTISQPPQESQNSGVHIHWSALLGV